MMNVMSRVEVWLGLCAASADAKAKTAKPDSVY